MKYHMQKGSGHKSHPAKHRKHAGKSMADPNHQQHNLDHGLPADPFDHDGDSYGSGGKESMAGEGNCADED